MVVAKREVRCDPAQLPAGLGPGVLARARMRVNHSFFPSSAITRLIGAWPLMCYSSKILSFRRCFCFGCPTRLHMCPCALGRPHHHQEPGRWTLARGQAAMPRLRQPGVHRRQPTVGASSHSLAAPFTLDPHLHRFDCPNPMTHTSPDPTTHTHAHTLSLPHHHPPLITHHSPDVAGGHGRRRLGRSSAR